MEQLLHNILILSGEGRLITFILTFAFVNLSWWILTRDSYLLNKIKGLKDVIQTQRANLDLSEMAIERLSNENDKLRDELKTQKIVTHTLEHNLNSLFDEQNDYKEQVIKDKREAWQDLHSSIDELNSVVIKSEVME